MPPRFAQTLTLAVVGAILPSLASSDMFQKHSRWLQVGPNPSAVVAADLNDDGLPEIVTADLGTLADPREERPAHDQLSFLTAVGDLEYEAQVQLPTGFGPYCIAVANIDALRAPDLVVGNFHAVRQRNLSLFRNLRENLFEPIHFAVPLNRNLPYKRMVDGDGAPVFTTPGITSLAVGHFNEDVYRDVIATGWSSDVLLFVPGVSDKYFGLTELIPAAGGPRDIQAADFDGDGKTDLAVTLYVSGQIGLWKGDGKGKFEPVTRFETRGRLPHKVRAVDVNGDKRLDLVVSHCYTDDSIVIFYGEGGFTFSTSQELLLGEDREVLEHEIRDIAVADFGGDGRADIAAACFGSSRVTVLVNDSKDSSLPQDFRQENYTYNEAYPRSLCTVDLDGDKDLDLLVTLWEANAVGLLLNK